MAFQREGILILAADAKLSCEILGRKAHAQVRVGIRFDQFRIRRDFVAAHRNHTHRLRAACQYALRGAGPDSIGGKCDGLQSRRAESIQRHGGHGIRNSSLIEGCGRSQKPLAHFGHRPLHSV